MNELLIDYLKVIENPDRIGWDSKTKRWVAPALKEQFLLVTLIVVKYYFFQQEEWLWTDLLELI